MTIYLDNAATSFPKPEAVYQAVDRAQRQAANPGRGGHSRSLAASRVVFDAREAVAGFFGIEDAGRVVFTVTPPRRSIWPCSVCCTPATGS